MYFKNRISQYFASAVLITAAVLFTFKALAPVYAGDKGFLFVPEGANFFVYGRGAENFIITQNHITEWKIDRSLSQLASGKRINSASDDPSGLAVAEKMEALLKGLKQESINDEDMRNLYAYAESAAGQDQEIVQRIRELIVRSAGGILAPDDREIIQTEIDELIKQIDMNAEFSQFNTVRVIPGLTSKGMGLDAIDVVHNPEAAIGIADRSLTILTKKRIMQGVKSNILTFRIEGKSYNYIHLMRAESSIRDLDMAEGISDLMKNCVLLKSRYGLIARPK